MPKEFDAHGSERRLLKDELYESGDLGIIGDYDLVTEEMRRTLRTTKAEN